MENGIVNGFDLSFIFPLWAQWKQWLMRWTSKENDDSYTGNTALLLVRTVEMCSGRLDFTHKTPKLSEYSQLEQLTYSICSKLDPGLLSQVWAACIVIKLLSYILFELGQFMLTNIY